MSSSEHEPEAANGATSLPRIDDLPTGPDGFDRARVREAFEAYRRRVAELEAELRVTRVSGSAGEPSGHAVRRDALHLIQTAAAFADTLERDAQSAAAARVDRAEEEVRARREELERREAAVENARAADERRRVEALERARAEGRDLVRSLSYSPATPPERVREASQAVLETSSLVTFGDFVACDGFEPWTEEMAAQWWATRGPEIERLARKARVDAGEAGTLTSAESVLAPAERS